MNSPETEIRNWIEQVVIGLNLCPFAKAPYDEGLFHTRFSEINNPSLFTSTFLDYIKYINDQDPAKWSNGVLVFSNLQIDYLNFLDLVDLGNDILVELMLEDEFQLVCFHPNFQFAETDYESKANFVNRSPYPLIHILRSYEVEFAVKNIKQGEDISFNNEKLLNSISDEDLKKLFPWCFS